MNNDLFFPGQIGFYTGKVRDIYDVDKVLVAITSNRISAFDRILSFSPACKGASLNLTAVHFFKATADIVPNCLLEVPHPRVAIWRKTRPFKFELIVRAYNTGSFDRDFSSKGIGNPWGYKLPILKSNEKFPELLVTPTTKAEQGEHDLPITKEEIMEKELASVPECEYIYDTTLHLFRRGQEMAKERGLILVDTKFEFGKDEDENIYLIDEVFTLDSSRYWYLDDYERTFAKGEDPKQLSKEFVRQYLLEHGFKGDAGDIEPEYAEDFIRETNERYIQGYEELTGNKVTEEIKLQWSNDENLKENTIDALLALGAIE